VTGQLAPDFAGLLRQLRAETGLTQEELAEAARLSPRTVSDLERGIHRAAHQDTARLLADALGLVEPVRALFVAAARGQVPAAQVLAARADAPEAVAAVDAATRPAPAVPVPHELPADVGAFTGRAVELAELDFLLPAGPEADATLGPMVVSVVGGQPVPLFYGSRPAWRDMAPGVTPGRDVRQLQRNLAALGYGSGLGLAVNGQFDLATELATERWQQAAGLPVTGTVPLGQVAFLPGPRPRSWSCTTSARPTRVNRRCPLSAG
jgi:transcriptional regulator with XRE-family HTH domain